VRRAAFLDRDGVLVETSVRDNHAFAPVTIEEFRVVTGAGAQVARLRAAGLLPIVVTNQPEVGRGLLSPETLAQMHARLREAVPVADILVCPHVDEDSCDCRKPRPGLLQAAADRWGLDLGRSFLVGDQWRDIDAGRAVGTYTVLLDRPYSRCPTADARVDDLPAAVDVVLARLQDDPWTS
jgi:D-glycero-D-manno-heptose 1,7-bisphosphate phosphatase